MHQDRNSNGKGISQTALSDYCPTCGGEVVSHPGRPGANLSEQPLGTSSVRRTSLTSWSLREEARHRVRKCGWQCAVQHVLTRRRGTNEQAIERPYCSVLSATDCMVTCANRGTSQRSAVMQLGAAWPSTRCLLVACALTATTAIANALHRHFLWHFSTFGCFQEPGRPLAMTGPRLVRSRVLKFRSGHILRLLLGHNACHLFQPTILLHAATK